MPLFNPPLLEDLRESQWKPAGGYQTIERHNTVNVAATLVSGRLHLAAMTVPAGFTCTTITFSAATTGAGTPTNQWFCLVDQATRAVLAYTSNDTTTAWAVNALKALNLTAPYTFTSQTRIYVGLMVTATTVPTIQGAASIAGITGISPIIAGSSNTGLTTTSSLGTVGTVVTAPSAHAAIPWALLT